MWLVFFAVLMILIILSNGNDDDWMRFDPQT